jgi:hypothetical protein
MFPPVPRLSAVWALAPALCLALFGSEPARASNQYLEIPPEPEASRSPAFSYANLSNQQALDELRRRKIRFVRAGTDAPGVRLPIRLTGPLRGVLIHSVLPPEERRDTPFEILDARLALALDDFCRILHNHDIVEVVHFTIYRPATDTPTDRLAPQMRHPGGLAIDIGALRKRNGEWLAVGPHWAAQVGARTCGRGARELISILCEAADQRVFHYMLTPHFDQAHADHVHLEIKPSVKWFLVN